MLLELPAIIDLQRIPELPEMLEIPSLDDYYLFFNSLTNETMKISHSNMLKAVYASGGGAFYTPVQTGNKIVYIVPPGKNGSDFVEMPAIAGMNFTLTRDMLELDPSSEFYILTGGGFKVNEALIGPLVTGQRFVLEVFELGSGAISASGGGSGKYINGKKLINTNYSVGTDDIGKRLYIRKSDDQLEIELPDCEMVPADSIVYLEAFIGNNRQHKIITTNGQYIYVGDGSREHVYIGKGERFAFLNDPEEGWYMIEGYEHILNVGQPKPVYKVGFNQLRLIGEEVDELEYPRLFDEVKQFGSSWVTEATWQTPSASVAGRVVLKPFRGCFSSGSEAGKFRLADWSNATARGLKNIGGTDNQRYQNISGIYQRHEFETHNHTINIEFNGTDGTQNGKHIRGTNDSEPAPTGTDSVAIQAAGGAETRMDNIGIIWVVNY